MAIKFNETNQWYSIADSATLTLPNSDWCIGIWTRVNDNTGTLFQYLLSNNNLASANSINFFLCEASQPDVPNRWKCTVANSAGLAIANDNTPGSATSSTAFGADGKNRLFVMQRRGNDFQCYAVETGQSASLEMSIASAPNWSSINGGAWNIGRRIDGNVDRYYGETAGDFFKGDFSLTSEQVTALGAGLTVFDLGLTPSVYIPFEESTATAVDIAGSNNATRNGTPTTAEYFPVGTSMAFDVFSIATGVFKPHWARNSNTILGPQ